MDVAAALVRLDRASDYPSTPTTFRVIINSGRATDTTRTVAVIKQSLASQFVESSITSFNDSASKAVTRAGVRSELHR